MMRTRKNRAKLVIEAGGTIQPADMKNLTAQQADKVFREKLRHRRTEVRLELVVPAGGALYLLKDFLASIAHAGRATLPDFQHIRHGGAHILISFSSSVTFASIVGMASSSRTICSSL